VKLRHIDIPNVCRLIPTWAANPIAIAKELDKLLAQNKKLRPAKWDKKLNYWIEFTITDQGKNQVRVAEPVPGQVVNPLQIGAVILDTERFQICVPLNAMLKGADNLDGMHSLYIHTLTGADGQRTYVGLTKQRWFDRLAQHRSAANCGSNLLFHRAIRQHGENKMSHIIAMAGISYEYAMETEEKFVDKMGLYPKGLNMIPGGFAGLKYLGTLGLAARTVEERDEAMDVLVRSDSLAGKPNPLCAARWTSDQEYVNSVICGHSCRLTLSQVRNIRMLNSAGYDAARIASVVQDSAERVSNVLRGKVYSRVV
jgi:hypothetical protein